MADMILGQRFLSRNAPAWHSKGTLFGEKVKISASEAVKKVAGDIEVEQCPIIYTSPVTGKPVELKDHFAIIRKPTHDDKSEKLLGIRTEEFHVVPYATLAKALDDLSKVYRVETCGLIQDGGLCFIAFKGPDFAVKGDRMQDYFIANLSQQPGVAHRVMAAPVRVVCFNTNQMALDQASISLSIPHSPKAADRIKLAGNLVAQFKEITAKSREIFEKFASVKITDKNLNLIIEAAFPNPSLPTELKLMQQAMSSGDQDVVKKAFGDKFAELVKVQEQHENRIARIGELRGAVRERYDVFDPPKLRGTVWAAYNAVTEVADWRGDGKRVGEATVWGSRAREKANAFAASMHAAGLVK